MVWGELLKVESLERGKSTGLEGSVVGTTAGVGSMGFPWWLLGGGGGFFSLLFERPARLLDSPLTSDCAGTSRSGRFGGSVSLGRPLERDRRERSVLLLPALRWPG